MRLTRLLACAFYVALAARPVLAQGVVDRDCEQTLVRAIDIATLAPSWRDRHPDVAYENMKPRMANDEWLALVDSIALGVENDSSLAEEQRVRLAANVRRLRDEVAFVNGQSNTDVLRRTAQIVSLARFRIEASRVRPGVYFLFRGTADSVVVDSSLSTDTRKAVCWRAIALARMLTAYGALARTDAATRLREASTRWDNYGNKGYSQFPWELALNSAGFSRSSVDPPKSQLIFLHPSLGVELLAPGLSQLDKTQRANTIAIEPIGYIRYTDSRALYYGVSAVVSLPSNRSAGFGAIAHVGQYVKLGYIFVRSPSEGEEGRYGLLVSADLYQFFSSVPTQLQQAKSRALSRLRSTEIDRIPP